MIETRVAYEAALAVYKSYHEMGRTSGDDWDFIFELALRLDEYERANLS